MISKSGGARMMEGLFFDALAENICKLAQLAEEKYLTFHLYRPYYWRNDCILCYVRSQYF
jgi:hypothetical protein